MKKTIKMASVKGHFITYLNKYLSDIGVKEQIDKKSKKLSYVFSLNDEYDLKIVLLRWIDIKEYAKEFDLVLFGSDQWLENGHKSMVILDKFEQDNCNISLMCQEGKVFDKNKKLATSYPNIASSYINGLSSNNIVFLSGSVEAAVALELADQILDIVDTGSSADANGFVNRTEIMKIHAVLGTANLNKIEFLKNIGLIKNNSQKDKTICVAFEGNEGAGKSTLAKHFTMNSLNGKPSVLVTPYSGYTGVHATPLLKSKKFTSWATQVGFNHWRPKGNINAIYDRNILTCLTELVDTCSVELIKDTIKQWGKLPDIIFYCNAGLDVQFARCNARKEKDIYDDYEMMAKYHLLYEKAKDFAANELGVKVCVIDTSKTITENIDEVKNIIEKEYY